MKLDVTSLEKAVFAFDSAVHVANDHSFMAGLTQEQSDTIRSGVIQSFEFTYELCWKFIQRWLKEHRHLEEAEHPRTRKELFRLAAKQGLIEHPEKWFDYGDARNITSHTYDRKTAMLVHEVANNFLGDAKIFLKKLKEKND